MKIGPENDVNSCRGIIGPYDLDSAGYVLNIMSYLTVNVLNMSWRERSTWGELGHIKVRDATMNEWQMRGWKYKISTSWLAETSSRSRHVLLSLHRLDTRWERECHVYRSKIVCGRIVNWHKKRKRSSSYRTGVPWPYIYPADPRRYGSRDRLYPISRFIIPLF